MKYYKTSKFARAITSTGFVTVVACVLIAIGAFTWFALSRSTAIPKTPSESNNTSSYPKSDNSYNSDTDIPDPTPAPTDDVAESEEEVPYEEPSQPEPTKEEKKPQQNRPGTRLCAGAVSFCLFTFAATSAAFRRWDGSSSWQGPHPARPRGICGFQGRA